MLYILMQLKNRGRGINTQPAGSIWSTSSMPNESFGEFEKFLEREKAEVLKKVRSHKQVVLWITKWESYARKMMKKHPGSNGFDLARKFFAVDK